MVDTAKLTKAGAVNREPIIDILDQWDKLSGAIDRVLTALPQQMTAAAVSLENERRAMRKTLQDVAKSARKPAGIEGGERG